MMGVPRGRAVPIGQMTDRERIIATSGHKDDAGKPRLALYSPIAFYKIGQVLEFGATKYTPYNWRKGMSWIRVASAGLRHFFSWLGGEDKDPETGFSHLAHLGCCVMFLLDYEETRKEFDDRYQRDDNRTAGISGDGDSGVEGQAKPAEGSVSYVQPQTEKVD